MNQVWLPDGYKPLHDLYQTQLLIGACKRAFEERLGSALNLNRVSAPLFVDPTTGLNDNLSGTERPVDFDIPSAGCHAQVVQSLAKWKRFALGRYGYQAGAGLYTDMNAIRRDEWLDNYHSVYVDQWDWERVITPQERTEQTLRNTVMAIVNAMVDTADSLQLPMRPCRDICFVTAQELEDLYPQLTPEERELAHVRLYKTVFVIGIGDMLQSGLPHGSRAPDYDDWTLNGDLIFHDTMHDRALEMSSMGIRVDANALDRQLRTSNNDERRNLPYHKALLNDELPLTIGGGIGQSRLCMYLLKKAHIGEVQVSVWDEETYRICKDAGINLL